MSWSQRATATAATTTTVPSDLMQGFANDKITIISVSQAIRASRLQLVDLAARLGRASDSHGSFANEGRLRSAYHTIFASLKPHLNALGQITPVQIEQELDLRAEKSEEWDASEPVQALRAMFDAESHAVTNEVNTSTSTSTRTETTGTGTSRKSQKYGPCKPDLVATLVVPSAGGSQCYSAVGEFKFDRQPPPEQDGQERNEIRDAQLLEGMCQTLWYIACGGELFGYRLAVLIINDGFKRFFRLDDGRIAIEVDSVSPPVGLGLGPELDHTPRPPRRRSARLTNLTDDVNIDPELDVGVLARGMHDAQCRHLCRLPNRILSHARDAPEPLQLSLRAASGPSVGEDIDGFDMPTLRRLLHFWAVALFLAASADQPNAQSPSASNISNHFRLADESTSTSRAQVDSPIRVEEMQLGSQEIARVGHLKHHRAGRLALAKAMKRGRGRQDRGRGTDEDDNGGGGIRRARQSGESRRGQDRRGQRGGRGGIARTNGSGRGAQGGQGQIQRGQGQGIDAARDAAVTRPQGWQESTGTRLLRVEKWRQTVRGPSAQLATVDPSETACTDLRGARIGSASSSTVTEAPEPGPWETERFKDHLAADVLDAETYAEHNLKPFQAVSRAIRIIDSLRLAGVSLIPVSPEAMDRIIVQAAAGAPPKLSLGAADISALGVVASSPEAVSSDGPITPPILSSRLPLDVVPSRIGGKVDVTNSGMHVSQSPQGLNDY